jgi:hypothetical protein
MSLRFQPGQRWTYDDIPLRFEREMGDDLLCFTVERTLAPLQLEDTQGHRWAPNRAWALEAFAAGRLRRVPEQPTLPIRRRAAEMEVGPDDLDKRG